MRLIQLLYCVLPIVCLLAAGWVFHLRVVEVGDQGLCFPAKNGDVISHTFFHSIYDVPVIERLKVREGSFNLFHVDSPSDAALEYYMIEGRHEGNVNRNIIEFCIPKSSNGGHVLNINDQSIVLGNTLTEGKSVCIRLNRLPVIVYCVRRLWR
jgi:hypothetical protein